MPCLVLCCHERIKQNNTEIEEGIDYKLQKRERGGSEETERETEQDISWWDSAAISGNWRSFTVSRNSAATFLESSGEVDASCQADPLPWRRQQGWVTMWAQGFCLAKVTTFLFFKGTCKALKKTWSTRVKFALVSIPEAPTLTCLWRPNSYMCVRSTVQSNGTNKASPSVVVNSKVLCQWWVQNTWYFTVK